MRPTSSLSRLLLLTLVLFPSFLVAADDDSPMVKLLRGGRVPAERQSTVIDMIGKRGNASDLGFLLEHSIDSKGFSDPNRLKALDALADAALTRDLRPSGDPARLAALVGSNDPAVRLAAVRLAGLWKAESLGPSLRSIAEAAETPAPLRAAAIDSLAAIGGKAGRTSIEALAAPGKPLAVRSRAVAALTRLDVDAAAALASTVIGQASNPDDLEPLLAAFLNRQGGADKLAAALGRDPIPADAAKLALRTVYTLGHSDASLVAALTKAAGLDAEVKALDARSMEQVVAEVVAKGDPARGETLFRRADLNCVKCHALSGSGGGVGPDLSAVGSSSPVDYVVNSIMLPDQAIKEEFRTLLVLTNDGQVFQGIVADKDDKRIVLKEANGQLRTVPTSEIEESKEGGSLMPKGLVNFMTRSEFIDVVRFLSELGKPGPYAIRSTQTIQRWRYLKPVPEGLVQAVPDPSTFASQVINADPSRWLPAYARTAGSLPLEELTPVAGPVLYLQGEVEVSHGDKVNVKLDSTAGVTAWVDDQPAPAFQGSSFAPELATGRHKLTFRVDTSTRNGLPLRVEVLKPPGSSAEYSVVSGR